MAAILNNLEEGDLLFVDEIHRLNRQVEEVLYPAMEDYCIDIMIGKGLQCQVRPSGITEVHTGRSDDPGGTFDSTSAGSLRMIHHLEFYTIEELQQIIMHSAGILDVEIEPAGAKEMARRSRGTPQTCQPYLEACPRFRTGQIRRNHYRRSSPNPHWILWMWTRWV